MKTLLNHEMCNIVQDGNELKVKIRMTTSGWVWNRPFPADLRGTIGALTLALDVISGKVILQEVVTEDNTGAFLVNQMIEAHTPKLIGGK